VAIGPEGGWTDEEVEMFDALGFARFSLGARILRTDMACVAVLTLLDYLRA
jgi:16S rRNA (uracil1498-N3)-methyltransferase